MNLREAAAQALEALENLDEQELATGDMVWLGKEIGNLRVALADATSHESRQVEPVAYVTGYNKGRCIIEAVDPDWLLPVGMAMYRSPPTISKTETVEPVAWLIESYDIYAKRTLQRLVFDNPKNMQGVKITAYYTAPPKRKPLTDEEIEQCMKHAYATANGRNLEHAFARGIEREHEIGGEE